MNEMVFNTMTDFFNHIHSRGGATNDRHGILGTFYSLMGAYTNPNTCSCKKGKGAYNNIFNVCRSLTTMSGDTLANSRVLFDNRGVILNENGREIARF